MKKLKAERAAGRLNQWRHAATKVARRALATERDEARVEVARLTAEVRRAKGLPAFLKACHVAAGGAALLVAAVERPTRRGTAPAALDRDRATAAA